MPIDYDLCGVVLASDLQLPALAGRETERKPGQRHITFTTSTEPHHFTRLEKIRDAVSATGAPIMRIDRTENGYLFRMPDAPTFWVRSDGQEIATFGYHGDVDTVEQILLDQTLPYALTLDGNYCLHGSCVAFGDIAIAFLGYSGAGKSTLAASLVPPAKLLADDAVVLSAHRPGEVWPSYGSVRLRNDSLQFVRRPSRPVSARMTWKHRVRLESADLPKMLRAIYVLESDNQPTIDVLNGADAFAAILPYARRVDPYDRLALQREHGLASSLVASVKVRRLRLPKDYGRLPDVQNLLYRDLSFGV